MPIDPFQCFPFDFAHRFPWTDLVDDFGFEDLRATAAPAGPRKRPNG